MATSKVNVFTLNMNKTVKPRHHLELCLLLSHTASYVCISCGKRQRATRKPASCGRITRSRQLERWTFTSCPRRRGRHTALLPPACRGRVPRTAGSAASARSLLPDTETACVRTPCLSLLASLQQRRTCCERRPRAQAAPRPLPALPAIGGAGPCPVGTDLRRLFKNSGSTTRSP